MKSNLGDVGRARIQFVSFFSTPQLYVRQKSENPGGTLCFSGSPLTVYQINAHMCQESTDRYWELEA